MKTTLQAGLAYFAAVFAAGFALGVVRVSWVEPALGRLAAVAIEIPLMLIISWIVCRWCIDKFRIPASAGPRLIMGGSAFLLLIVTEFALSVAVLGTPAVEVAQSYAEPAKAIGLVSQIVFGMFPVLQIQR